MNKPFPALCSECKFSKPDPSSSWTLNCHNPKVNARDAYALGSSSSNRGTACVGERERFWFAKCGRRGLLWESV